MESIYLYNAFRGVKKDSYNSESYYLLTRLLNFRNEQLLKNSNNQDFAEKLLSVIQKHPLLEKTSRLCVAVSYPLSSQIGVLSSAATCGKNLMEDGYSCFVSSSTSLGSIKIGSARVYSDINHIINNFVESNRPIQKSIYYLQSMGIKSGVTIKLESEGIAGYLFLNSNEVGYFDDILSEDSTYINLLELIVSDYFKSKTSSYQSVLNVSEYLKNFPIEKIHSNGHLNGEHGVNEIADCISFNLDEPVKLEVIDKTDKNHLLPWGQISLITSLLLKELGFLGSIGLSIRIFDNDGTMKIVLASNSFKDKIEKLPFEHYRGIRRFAKNMGIELIKQKDAFIFQLGINYSSHSKKYDYSVAEQG